MTWHRYKISLSEQIKRCLIFFSVTRSAYFWLHKNKRLTTTVTKTLAIDSPLLCVNLCLATEGCLGVNFLRPFKPSCEMTSDHISTGDLADHNNSDVWRLCRWYVVYISFKHKKIFNPLLLKIFFALLVALQRYLEDIGELCAYKLSYMSRAHICGSQLHVEIGVGAALLPQTQK